MTDTTAIAATAMIEKLRTLGETESDAAIMQHAAEILRAVLAERDTARADARTALEQSGFTVIRATTYRNTQERIRIAEQRLLWEAEHNASTVRWAEAAFTEQRRLGDRLTFVYGEARAAGLTAEQLTGPTS